MKLGIRSKLFLLSLGLIILVVLVLQAYLSSVLERYLLARTREDLLIRLALVEQSVSSFSAPLSDSQAWGNLASELGKRARARVTLVRADGVVLGDSEVGQEPVGRLGNHADRPEIAEALAKGSGESTRYSVTIQGRMLYEAHAFGPEKERIGVVRLALPLVEIDRSVATMRRLLAIASLLAVLVAALLSGLATQLASRTARALTSAAKTMAQGDLSVRVRVAGKDEFAELAQALNQLALNLSDSLSELRSERNLLGGILDNMQEGVFLLDRDQRVALGNPSFREMFLVGSDYLGKPLLEVVRHAELKLLVDRVLANREPVKGEVSTLGLRPRRLLVHASEAGPGLLVVLVDVTEIRRLESVRRDFVASASHELRTPVASARSALETLRSAWKNDPAAADDFLDIIDRNVERLHLLIQDLLDLSRLESREYRLELEPVVVAPAVIATLALFQVRANKRRLKTVLDLPEDLPAVRADRRALEQILTNLVDNAVKYSSEGARIRIHARVDEALVRICVEDSGPGIAAEHLPRLFERFYRVDPGRSRELGGTGLGLSIVKHLVEAMQGVVQVESTVGVGTVFSFTLVSFRS